MLDFNSKTAARQDFAGRFAAQIDKAFVTQAGEQAPRDYLGVSSIGRSCLRQIQYDYTKTPKDEDGGFDGKTLRIFERGHLGEVRVAEWMRWAGAQVVTHKADGFGQIGFSAADGRWKGHIDGVILEWPDCPLPELKVPALWENKILGAKGWKSITSKSLVLAYPVYAAQIAVYQSRLDLTENPALFTAINADTMEIHAELVPFDAALAQRMEDRAAQIIMATEASELLPRCTTDPTHFECQWCSWKGRCWANG